MISKIVIAESVHDPENDLKFGWIKYPSSESDYMATIRLFQIEYFQYNGVPSIPGYIHGAGRRSYTIDNNRQFWYSYPENQQDMQYGQPVSDRTKTPSIQRGYNSRKSRKNRAEYGALNDQMLSVMEKRTKVIEKELAKLNK